MHSISRSHIAVFVSSDTHIILFAGLSDVNVNIVRWSSTYRDRTSTGIRRRRRTRTFHQGPGPSVKIIAYMLVWNLSKSVNDKYFIIAAEFASCIFAYSASLRLRLAASNIIDCCKTIHWPLIYVNTVSQCTILAKQDVKFTWLVWC